MADNRKTPKPRHNPFRGFLDVMSEMSRAQEQWMKGGGKVSGSGRTHAGAYVPPADIFAIGQDLIVRCEVPGVRSEDVSVTVASSVLTISGRRSSELNEDEVLYYTRERVYGEFRRAMILPNGVDESDINATVRNGLLEIRVSGGAAAKPHAISVVDQNED
ncbi:Hsp20/alpha crystallin family protein [Salinisphaera sp. LB1]|uniref:Hsp20/alpha crystallin family protein n=1 Tax=Salinisphaera sp. LB1 TaxID=2183911 RepID=UPI000D70622F|nr:Hsp20/alpha crystallin family protein [Salinisphaera sp. LB1]AWN15103.1 Molecular chaperone (small heat shock protein) [Salinisphaera sp. LB1]